MMMILKVINNKNKMINNRKQLFNKYKLHIVSIELDLSLILLLQLIGIKEDKYIFLI